MHKYVTAQKKKKIGVISVLRNFVRLRIVRLEGQNIIF